MFPSHDQCCSFGTVRGDLPLAAMAWSVGLRPSAAPTPGAVISILPTALTLDAGCTFIEPNPVVVWAGGLLSSGCGPTACARTCLGTAEVTCALVIPRLSLLAASLTASATLSLTASGLPLPALAAWTYFLAISGLDPIILNILACTISLNLFIGLEEMPAAAIVPSLETSLKSSKSFPNSFLTLNWRSWLGNR